MAHQALYQINTRVHLRRRAAELGRPATLDDVSDDLLDHLARQGFDWVWFLGVWRTGPAGRRVSLTNPEWRREFAALLPDLTDDDVAGSCFAVAGYEARPDLGGAEALARLRKRVHRRGMRLMLDFVPNHLGPDHPWVHERPDHFVAGTEEKLAAEPGNWGRFQTIQGEKILAFGRDPYFPGWPDTVQLDYGREATRQDMTDELLRVAGQCDGLRCDMAMLVLPEVFQRTWGIAAEPFWPRAIARVRAAHPRFVFMAEVYWDLEWTLQRQGFDFTYDKRLYDRLVARAAGPVRGHLRADPEFQRRSARFLENHDEPRAAVTFPPDIHQAAAVITFLVPGLRFFHEGQLQGWRQRIPMHLSRGPDEPENPFLVHFYDDLLGTLRRPEVRDGYWQLLERIPAWEGNGTWRNIIAFAWSDARGLGTLVAVNYAPTQAQCYVPLPFSELRDKSVELSDRMGTARYVRGGYSLLQPGLYLDIGPWAYHVFNVAWS